MKKVLSVFLVVAMLTIMIPTALALPIVDCIKHGDNPGKTGDCGHDVCVECEYCPTCNRNGNWGAGTKVSYTGTGTENWTVTVPATMTAGSSANVVVNGTWASNRKLVVSAADKVTMTNREDGATHDLDVTFSDIALVGSNTTAVSKTESIAIQSMSDIMFGVWEGTFTYNADMVDVSTTQIITFTIDGTSYQAEDGMTWGEWVDSIYDNDEYYHQGAVYDSSPIIKCSVLGAVVDENNENVMHTDIIMANKNYIYFEADL